MDAFLTGLGIHQPGRSSNTTQQGIPVLRRKAEAGNLMPVPHRQRRYGDHCLVQNAAKEALITAKGKDRVGHGFFGEGHILVRFELLNYLVQRHGPLDLEVKPDAMHVLRVQLDRGGKEIQVQAPCVEQAPGIIRMMRAKLGIFVFPGLGGRDKTLFLANITGTSHADKAAFEQVIRRFLSECEGFRQDGQIVSITAHDLNEAILLRHQRPIVDATRIRLAKARLAPLSEKPAVVGIC